ncbi:hypothetical protein IFM89_018967 [Coptis chinensis]|uniref:Transmembrane protein n=1 Tax=Coptis chinensis TaxID=261450 RepID=A0A835I581_9MAGN|nr:hypothetical protein IFM89_018967 [Coptis chinensis]
MSPAINMQLSNPASKSSLQTNTNITNFKFKLQNLHSQQRPSNLRFPKHLHFSSLSIQSDAPLLTTSVGSPPPSLSQWNLTNRHITLLNAVACVAAISTSWLFFSAIPALLAFRKAALSLEKLMDVMREELPDTMAAVRLSGMEISDLTMELSDLGQEITKGVRNSTQAVRVAEDRLRRLTTMVPNALVQEQVNLKTEAIEPVLAKTARGVREGIVKGRAFLQMFFSITRFSRLAINYLAARKQKL